MSAEQLSMFEPTGPEVLDLAARHERCALRLRKLHESLNVRGWEHASRAVLRSLIDAEQRASECYMLAEFEALGCVNG